MLSRKEFSRDFAVKDAVKILSGSENCELVAGVYIEPPERSSPKNTNNLSPNKDQFPFLALNDEYFEMYAEIIFANYRRTCNRNSIIKVELSLQKEEKTSIFPEPNYTKYIAKTPIQMFELFFDKEVINLIHLATIRNAHDQKYDLSSLTPEEIKKFLAILLLSGYNKILRPPACYWEAPDVRNELVANSMHQERFIEIYEYINFELQPEMTEENKQDRIWMLRPLITLLQKRFVVNLPPEEVINFDEYMVDSFRRFDYKDMRHIPVGYKVSCLNTPSGYLIDFYVHNTKLKDGIKYANELGLAAAPLLIMLDRQPNNIRNLPYKIYFGDLKTNTEFLTELKQRGYSATGIFGFSKVDKSYSFYIGSCSGSSENIAISTLLFPESNEIYLSANDSFSVPRSGKVCNLFSVKSCDDISNIDKESLLSFKLEEESSSIPIASCNGHSENTGNGTFPLPILEGISEFISTESGDVYHKNIATESYSNSKLDEKYPSLPIGSCNGNHSENTGKSTYPVPTLDEISEFLSTESGDVYHENIATESYPSLPTGSCNGDHSENTGNGTFPLPILERISEFLSTESGDDYHENIATESYPSLPIGSCNGNHSENTGNGTFPLPILEGISDFLSTESGDVYHENIATESYPSLPIGSCNGDHSENTGNGTFPLPILEGISEFLSTESGDVYHENIATESYPSLPIGSCNGDHSENTSNSTYPVATLDEISEFLSTESGDVYHENIATESYLNSKLDDKYSPLPIGSCNGDHFENIVNSTSPLPILEGISDLLSLETRDVYHEKAFPVDFQEEISITNVVENGGQKTITGCADRDNPFKVFQIIGTETMKKYIENYRIGICDGRKWYWPLFTWLLDVSVHNAWLLMQKAGSNISQLEFRRAVVRAYLDEKVPTKPPFPARNASFLY